MANPRLARDTRSRNMQKLENKTLVGLLHILQLIRAEQLFPEVTVNKYICPHDGCLLFDSDPSCPACRARVLENS